jgi:hypothetical protein
MSSKFQLTPLAAALIAAANWQRRLVIADWQIKYYNTADAVLSYRILPQIVGKELQFIAFGELSGVFNLPQRTQRLELHYNYELFMTAELTAEINTMELPAALTLRQG